MFDTSAQQRLSVDALLYVTDSLSAAERDAYERRLGEDQSEREAVSAAVRMVQTCAGRGSLRPSPAYRQRVERRLRARQRNLWRFRGIRCCGPDSARPPLFFSR